MPVLTWATHHRLWALGIGFAVVLAAVAAGIWFFLLRSPGTQVDLRQALRLYRHDQRSTTAATTGLIPPPGVYAYRTSGYERLSLGGISRSFPPTSEMIVTAAACTTVRWVPFEQHMEGLVECPGRNGAVMMSAALSDEEIAGVRTTESIHCPQHAYFLPPRPTVGQHWTATCHSSGQTIGFSGRVLGWSTISVGGDRRSALHTRITLTFAGSEAGTNPTDYWVSAANGVILREKEAVDLAQRTGPLGSVRYSEEMAVGLSSLAAAH